MTATTQSGALAERYVEDFREQGFVHVPALLTAAEVPLFRTASLDAIGEARTSKDEENTQIIATVDGWEYDPTLRQLALHPHIGAIAERLAGMPLRVWGGEVFVKQPKRSARTNLHDDQTFELLDSRVSLNAWVALVDVPVERGCLSFLPGSHHRADPERIDLAAATRDPDTYLLTHWPQLRWSSRVTVPLRAGDATFHHRRTAHSAGANNTDRSRVSFVITFTDAEATYRPLPDADPLDLRPGQALPDDRYPRVGGGRS